MSHKFKKKLGHAYGQLTVADNGENGAIYLAINSQGSCAGVGLEDAAEVMLAISAAAGIVHHDPEDTPYDLRLLTENMGDLNIAAHYLARHVNQAEKAAHIAAKEAADREALESEAEALWIAAKQDGWIDPDGWDGLGNDSRHMWVSVAKRARTFREATQ